MSLDGGGGDGSNPFKAVHLGQSTSSVKTVSFDFTPLKKAEFEAFVNKALVGVLLSLEGLSAIRGDLSEVYKTKFSLKYLGGLKVLILFNREEEAGCFLRSNFDWWSSWFSRLFVWDGALYEVERVAWVRISGVPVKLWDKEVFACIGYSISHVLRIPDSSWDVADLSKVVIAVLFKSGAKISLPVQFFWKNLVYHTWLEKEGGDWDPWLLSVISSPAMVVSPTLVEDSDQEAVRPSGTLDYETMSGMEAQGANNNSGNESSCMRGRAYMWGRACMWGGGSRDHVTCCLGMGISVWRWDISEMLIGCRFFFENGPNVCEFKAQSSVGQKGISNDLSST
ncbi:hypothetical protein Hdeb2414_s0012g00383251 [Helianthus debilis subsp. tardiflorus]